MNKPLEAWIEQWGTNLDWEAKANLCEAVQESEIKQEIRGVLHDIRNMPDGSTYSIALVREMLESLLDEEAKEMKQYFDPRGHVYFVRAGLGENQFKTFCRKPDKAPGYGEHAYRTTPWRTTPEEAQKDLDALALREKWKGVK